MPRCRVLEPVKTRIRLADIAKRRLETLQAELAGEKRPARKALLQRRVELAVDDLMLAEHDGDWLDVKQRLTAGETQDMFAAMRVTPDAPGVDPAKVRRARILAFVIDWSLVDDTGARLPVSEEVLKFIAPEDFQELAEAVDAHESQVELELAASKKTQADALRSSAISTSAV